MLNFKNRPLPAGWDKCALPEFVRVEMGQSPSSTTYNYEKKGVPFFQGKAEFGELYRTIDKYCSERKNKILSGSIRAWASYYLDRSLYQ